MGALLPRAVYTLSDAIVKMPSQSCRMKPQIGMPSQSMQDDIASDKMDIELKTGYDIDESVIGLPGLISDLIFIGGLIVNIMADD